MTKDNIKHDDVLQKIIENYQTLEAQIINELQFAVKHSVTVGHFREKVWKDLFEQIIPRKFVVEQSVFIIDPNKKVTKEVDLAIFDEQYTPYIFRYRNIKYIPIEAVMAVVQCKSTDLKQQELKEWAESVSCLRTSLDSVVRIQSGIICGNDIPKSGSFSQSSTRPIQILCHTKDLTPKSVEGMFDIVIHPENMKLHIHINQKRGITIDDWYKELNHVGYKTPDEQGKQVPISEIHENIKDRKLEKYKVMKKDEPDTEVTLLSLVFQLNQLLMLINNPILFPHLSYAEMFSKIMKSVPHKQ